MALYELKEAMLGGVEGRGYAYVVDTYQGKAYRGVFFAENEETVDEAKEATEPVPFEGTVYHKTVERIEALDVNVTKKVNVAVGTRADFEVLDS